MRSFKNDTDMLLNKYSGISMTTKALCFIILWQFNPLLLGRDNCKSLDIATSFYGQQVTSSQDIDFYQGYAGHRAIVGELRQKVYRFRYYQLKANYNGGVDYQLLDKIAILCPQTADFLYE